MFLPNYYIWGYICFEIYIYLKTSEAASARKGYETNVWLAISWNRFVNYESPVFHFGSTGLLHLPKLLKGFNHINWNTYICLVYACIFGTSHNNITSMSSMSSRGTSGSVRGTSTWCTWGLSSPLACDGTSRSPRWSLRRDGTRGKRPAASATTTPAASRAPRRSAPSEDSTLRWVVIDGKGS